MAFQTMGLAHLELRVTDLARARTFYTQTLGFEHVKDGDGFVVVNINGMMLGLVGASDGMQPDDRFVPHRVGLDHVALGIADVDALHSLQQQLATPRACRTTALSTMRLWAVRTSAFTTLTASPGSCTRCRQRDRQRCQTGTTMAQETDDATDHQS